MSIQRWFLPTNTENLEIFLSSGLVFCSAGFNGSYLKDAIDGCPAGYIPFFSEDNLSDAIVKSYEEDENLVPCLIKLDLSQILKMDVYVDDSQDSTCPRYIKLNIENIIAVNEYKNFLLPSPLPLQCIESVSFEQVSKKNQFAKQLGKMSECFPSNFLRKGTPKLFKLSSKSTDTGQSGNILSVGGTNGQDEDSKDRIETPPIPANNIDYNRIFSLGGMLSLMFYQTKNGQLSIDHFEAACALKLLQKDVHPEFKFLNNYFYDGGFSDDKYGQLNHELLKLLSEDNGTTGEIKHAIIEHLSSSKNFTDLQRFIDPMADWLRKISDRHENFMDPMQIFTKLMASYAGKENKEKKKILMILIMYFFRDHVETMLKFYHKDFEEIDYILFAMFFGVGCQYIGLPPHIKNIKGLGYYISNRMAEHHHQAFGDSCLSFKDVSAPDFIVSGLIREKSKGERDKFTEWFSGFLQLESNKFQSWELISHGYSCDMKQTLTSHEEPKITTKLDINSDDLDSDDFKRIVDTEYESVDGRAIRIIEHIKSILNSIQSWSISTKGYSCDGRSTLKFEEKPKLTSIVDMSELERQILVSTIGNDKELFDYNEIYDQYKRLAK